MGISIKGLSKRFGDKVLFDGLSCELPYGAAAAVTGPSGAGKTTFINILLGLEKPDAGTIEGLSDARFTCVFQEDRLFENMTVRRNLRLVCPPSVTDGDIERHLAALLLAGEAPTRVRNLSGGMKRRVALARAVLAGGNALALDEPFKGLDDEAKAAACAYIKHFAGDRLILIVTHDLKEADMLGAAQLIRIGEDGAEELRVER